MTTLVAVQRQSPAVRAVWLTAGIGLAAAWRAAVNGHAAPSAFAAGGTFGLLLLVLAAISGWRMRRPSVRSLAAGLVGGAVLVGIPLLLHPQMASIVGMRPQPFWGWVGVTVLVATAEEVAFRGALLDTLAEWGGWPAAVVASSFAFALIHVPLYGWGVVPIDLGVGVWLAGLRLLTGGVAAPAVAHVIADLATWWL
jgi:membrane protease YdiL (CAAX protease family)